VKQKKGTLLGKATGAISWRMKFHVGFCN